VLTEAALPGVQIVAYGTWTPAVNTV